MGMTGGVYGVDKNNKPIFLHYTSTYIHIMHALFPLLQPSNVRQTVSPLRFSWHFCWLFLKTVSRSSLASSFSCAGTYPVCSCWHNFLNFSCCTLWNAKFVAKKKTSYILVRRKFPCPSYLFWQHIFPNHYWLCGGMTMTMMNNQQFLNSSQNILPEFQPQNQRSSVC